MATFIDEDDEAISFMSPLFTKEELSSSQSREVLSMIQDQLRVCEIKFTRACSVCAGLTVAHARASFRV
jgi:hypothetical protein